MENNQKAINLLSTLNKRITTKNNELLLLLCSLKAVEAIHHSHHWQTKGKNYYSDHLLFERLFTDIISEIDPIGENVIVFSGRKATNYFVILEMAEEFCEIVTVQTEDLITNSLSAEKLLIEIGKMALEKAKSINEYGLEQAIGNVLDKHNSHVYLLTGRE